MSRSPPGGWSAPIGWPPERGWGPVPQPGGQQAEVLEFRSGDGVNPGLALIRDGNGTRSLETLLRYRNAAVAEFTRALRTLKALQAEQAANVMERPAYRPAARISGRVEPNEPKGGAAPRPHYAMPDPPVTGPTLHEPAAPWLPHRHETASRRVARHIGASLPNEPEAARDRGETSGRPADHASAA